MGRKQFESVVAQAPKKRLFQYNSTQTTALNSGSDEVVYIYAPVNQVAKCRGIGFQVSPSTNATSGTHRIIFSYDLNNTDFGSQNIDLLWSEGNHNETVGVIRNDVLGSVNAFPTDNVTSAINSITFDEFTPLMAVYSNKTNASQDKARVIILAFESEEVASL